MTKRHRRTGRGLYYQTLADGYKLLKPEVAETYQSAADYYDHSDLEANKMGEDEGTATR